ncbi:DNA repair protein RecN [Porphyromonas cangingivalis]|uniref:DNA repair protein RecN n=1 Tax=Porphyromonas cangingivalis TaxID=36874 RepID=A0A1T4M1X9_PORCN|nr:DNA repair protein RecN [Porphyromonas cangingivalis]SJZ60963.1 DNA repair protein RecN (Recombination protein N) [Porphyromonas cangingivalis]VEJ03823.1 Recombination protein N [Porphyromonas cangingivalis]
MIQHIHIKDFVLIDELSLDLRPGFSSITGETGAGKSILIGAIGLVSGNRADSRAVREGAAKAIIEVVCSVENKEALKVLFDDNDLDFGEVCTLRREITSGGKSRAFINDTPVTTNLMKEVGGHLIDIHSQHHNMLIGEPAYQMGVVDTLAGTAGLLEEYKGAYSEYKSAQRKLEEERERIEKQRKDIDYIQFQYQQLDEAKIHPNEIEEIEERLALVHNAQDITEALSTLVGLADRGSMEAPLDEIAMVAKKLGKITDSYTQAAEMAERLEAIRIELSDLTALGADAVESLSIDHSEVELLEQRADLLQSLLFKHNLKSTSELITLRDDYETQLQGIDDADDHILRLEKEVSLAFKKAKTLADKLTQKRLSVSETLLPELEHLIKELGISGATFAIELTPAESLSYNGADKISFLFATNKQTSLRPIREIASGGEISRFMLALKTILAARAVLPTVIFDEIDTGVSGEVAGKLGKVMQTLSRNLQVITITHLPQIAALADHQYVVSKREEDTTFVTTIEECVGEDRVTELAGMLSGAHVTEAAIQNARALLLNNKR